MVRLSTGRKSTLGVCVRRRSLAKTQLQMTVAVYRRWDLPSFTNTQSSADLRVQCSITGHKAALKLDGQFCSSYSTSQDWVNAPVISPLAHRKLLSFWLVLMLLCSLQPAFLPLKAIYLFHCSDEVITLLKPLHWFFVCSQIHPCLSSKFLWLWQPHLSTFVVQIPIGCWQRTIFVHLFYGSPPQTLSFSQELKYFD